MADVTSSRTGAALLVVVAIGLGGPAARAGYCAGDRARLQIITERLGHALHLAVEEVRIGVRHVGLKSRTAAIQLALWSLHLQSRQSLADGLAQQETPSADGLVETLRPLWERSVELRRGLEWQAGESGPALDETVRYALAAKIGCRAIQAADPGTCLPLADLFPELLQSCQQDALMVGLIFSHRCEPELVERTAARAGVPTEALLAYCRAVAGSDPAACEQVPGLPPVEVSQCKALAGQGEAACRDEPGAEQRGGSCRRQVVLYGVVRGRPVDWTALGRIGVRILDRAHLVSGRDSAVPCADVALLVHDLRAARFFDLDCWMGLPLPRLW